MPSSARVAVVTGGASGIGRASSLHLAKDGAAIAVWDLDAAGAEETVALVGKAGGRAIACAVNAASREGIMSALARTRSELGPVTILINNAALTGVTPFLEMTDEAWDHMIEVNLKGPFLCIRAMLPDMVAARWGRIINITTSSAQLGTPYMSHYVSSKGGLIGLTKALAMEYAAHGITVNHVPPGYVDTPTMRRNSANYPDAPAFEVSAANTPMKRAGKPEEVAAACAFLASEDAAYITGQTISVNGGRYLS